jgi:hypothetical protein
MLLKVKNNGAIKKVVFKPEYQCFEILETFITNLTQRPSKSFNLYYMDDENEEVMIKDQIDLEVFLHFASDRKFLELNIKDKSALDIESDFIEIKDVTRLSEINKNCESFMLISKEMPANAEEPVSEFITYKNDNFTVKREEIPLPNELSDENLARSDPNLLLSINSEKQLFDNIGVMLAQATFSNPETNDCKLPLQKVGEIKKIYEKQQQDQNASNKRIEKSGQIKNGKVEKSEKKDQSEFIEVNSATTLNFRKDKKEELPVMKFHCCCCDTEAYGFRVVFCLVCAYQLCGRCHEIVVHEHPMIITPVTIDNSFLETLKKKYAKLSLQKKFLMKNAKPLADVNKFQKRPDNLHNDDLDNFEQTPETDENLSKVELTNAIAKEYLTSEEIEAFVATNDHLILDEYLLALENHLNSIPNK